MKIPEAIEAMRDTGYLQLLVFHYVNLFLCTETECIEEIWEVIAWETV
jgi:hypothetical protein